MATDDDDSEFRVEIDTLPDNDSFLPRYLTVQLLEILATTINHNQIKDQNGHELKNPQFVAGFKSHDLFTPLTYSIFWREGIEQALLDNKQSLDTIDEYNRAPLTLAIANEDFELAHRLVQKGAALLLEDKLVFEIALIAMLQRNPDFIKEVLGSKTNYDLSWAKEYLEYLQSYIVGQPKKTPLRYHEVLNPPIRYFGQVLDTLAYFNGLPSHYGFISPSIEILTAHLQVYATQQNDPNYKNMFTAIADAYDTTRQVCNYYANLPTAQDAARILASKIVANFKTNNGNAVVLFGGWAGNSVAIAFVHKALIFSNLGIGGTPDAGTKIFEITNPDNINEELVDAFIRGLGNATSPSVILDLLGSVVDSKPLLAIQQGFNPIDNCIFVNPRAVIQGILLVLSAYAGGGNLNAASLGAKNAQVGQAFASYVDSLHKFSSADLAKAMRNKELLQNKRVECCALALDYINQHYTEPQALERCIELKNALEFVGLKDFYNTSITPEAQAMIQARMINQQEATAIQVIEQENAMIAQGAQKK